VNIPTITPPDFAPASRQAALLLVGAVEKLARREKTLQAAAAAYRQDGSIASRVEWEQAKRSRDDAARRVSVLRQAAGLDPKEGS
jgi:hypothetical protein